MEQFADEALKLGTEAIKRRLSDACRLCFTEDVGQVDIFAHQVTSSKLYLLANQYGGLSISERDGGPSKACIQCAGRLVDVDNFCKSMQLAQKKLSVFKMVAQVKDTDMSLPSQGTEDPALRPKSNEPSGDAWCVVPSPEPTTMTILDSDDEDDLPIVRLRIRRRRVLFESPELNESHKKRRVRSESPKDSSDSDESHRTRHLSSGSSEVHSDSEEEEVGEELPMSFVRLVRISLPPGDCTRFKVIKRPSTNETILIPIEVSPEPKSQQVSSNGQHRHMMLNPFSTARFMQHRSESEHSTIQSSQAQKNMTNIGPIHGKPPPPYPRARPSPPERLPSSNSSTTPPQPRITVRPFASMRLMESANQLTAMPPNRTVEPQHQHQLPPFPQHRQQVTLQPPLQPPPSYQVVSVPESLPIFEIIDLEEGNTTVVQQVPNIPVQQSVNLLLPVQSQISMPPSLSPTINFPDPHTNQQLFMPVQSIQQQQPPPQQQHPPTQQQQHPPTQQQPPAQQQQQQCLSGSAFNFYMPPYRNQNL